MIFVFGECSLDTDRRELRRGMLAVDLEPQVFDLLAYLLRSRDRVVSRDDLLDAVWNGRIVSESTLSSRINAARAAIGDDGTAQRWIRTLPRKGFRFVGEVSDGAEAAEEPPPPAPVRCTIETTDGPAIAVLPFTNMSGDPDSDYFADGMVEEIITALARCGGILVIARNSTFTYKGQAVDVRDVGRDLGVGYVLEGSVRRSGTNLRITAQLIETSTGTHLWADRFDGSLDDAFDLQDNIASAAAAVIEPKLRFAEVQRIKRSPPSKHDAYDRWLRAVAHAADFTRESMTLALKSLEDALQIDPGYALAMASSAYYRAQWEIHGWGRQSVDERREAVRLAREAVQRDKDDPNVLWQSAWAIWVFEHDERASRNLLRRALEINPSSAIALTMSGWLEAATSHPEEARRLIERARRLNPRHPRGWLMATGMAVAFIGEGRFQEAVAWAERAIVLHPKFGVAQRALAVALVNAGEVDRARLVVRDLVAKDPHLTLSSLRQRFFSGSELMQVYTDALRAAGLPE